MSCHISMEMEKSQFSRAERLEKLYLPKNSFLEVLKQGGAASSVLSLKQILLHMIAYIKQKNLFDPKDVRNVRCENDEIGVVFGVKSFTINDVMELIGKNLYKIPSSTAFGNDVLSSASNKRNAVELSSNEYACQSKQIKVSERSSDASPQCSSNFCRTSTSLAGETSKQKSFVHISVPPSPQVLSGSESDVSLQGYETAYVIDTPDTCSSSDDSDFDEGKVYEVEFDVESVKSSCTSSQSDTDADINDVMRAEIYIQQIDADVEFWADDSCNGDDEQFSDAELPNDCWKCNCGEENKPLLRNCSKCWSIRKDWLPENNVNAVKPHRKRKRSNKKHKKKSICHQKVCSQALSDSQGSAINAQACDSKSTSSQNSASQNDQNGLCMICLTRPKSASLIHGRTGHQVCCYPCGKKLEKKRKPCPVCRRTVSSVIKNFIV